MLLGFTIHGEDDERIHIDPFAVMSIREHDVNGVKVATVLMEYGDSYRVLDHDRTVVKEIVTAREWYDEEDDEDGVRESGGDDTTRSSSNPCAPP